MENKNIFLLNFPFISRDNFKIMEEIFLLFPRFDKVEIYFSVVVLENRVSNVPLIHHQKQEIFPPQSFN